MWILLINCSQNQAYWSLESKCLFPFEYLFSDVNWVLFFWIKLSIMKMVYDIVSNFDPKKESESS
jgi:hypothetical protein